MAGVQQAYYIYSHIYIYVYACVSNFAIYLVQVENDMNKKRKEEQKAIKREKVRECEKKGQEGRNCSFSFSLSFHVLQSENDICTVSSAHTLSTSCLVVVFFGGRVVLDMSAVVETSGISCARARKALEILSAKNSSSKQLS